MILTYKDSSIYHTIEGNGEPIVLLHGFLETSAMWKDLVPELSINNKIISIDLLGHGNSDCIGYVHTMEAMADSVFAVLEHLNVESTIVIGHSMGGYVALALAEKQPKLFKGICLMNSTFEADDPERKALRLRANNMAKTQFENLVRMSFTNLFAPESKIKFENELNNALQTALQQSVQGYIAASEGMRLRKSRFEVLKHLNAKKLIITGKKDWIIDNEKLKSKIENTDINYKELSEGHMSHIENKSELSYILKQFIEK